MDNQDVLNDISNNSLSDTIENITEELIAGKCVLFLGPELLINTNEEKSYTAFFKELSERNNQIIFKYFTKTNVFSFLKSGSNNENAVKEKKIRNEIAKFYDTTGDEIILNLIAQLPFPLIVNVAPDTAINKIFKRNMFKYRPAHFPSPEFYDIKKPTIDDPIIYNIFGSIEDKQSIIITYEELFRRIKDLMQKNAVPLEIEKAIQSATSFIFLGMKFETWYYQLLLSIFNIEISPSTKLGAPRDSDEETVSMMNKYFQIDFTSSNPLDFISKLYDEISKKDTSGIRRSQINIAKSCYFSYAWNDKSNSDLEKWVDAAAAHLNDSNLKIFRDKNELTIKDSIQSFMNRIGKGRIVLLTVSDKYLRSEYCMYEAWSVFKNDNFLDRAFIMILPDVDLQNKEVYIKYWQDKTNEKRKKIETEFNNDFIAFDSYMLKYKEEFYILLFINEFLRILTDKIWFRIKKEDTEENKKENELGFSNFVKKMLTTINEIDGTT